MALDKDIISAVAKDPEGVRDVFSDQSVIDALAELGIVPTIYELHAPAAGARKSTGLGLTKCGIRGRRLPTLVTCKKCLK